ncbi:concanavalin A-like lectin/glucanase domain-containing protein [Phaeosphaeriaceae sp. PMI808]|nr:concanavalin A-like lectin/glucanase domain-containing protein [Phaeosphaeriaceae sp. PMI808]
MRASVIISTCFLTIALASPAAQLCLTRRELAAPRQEASTPTVREATAVDEPVSLCSQYAYHAANGYEILNNLWGKDQATSGSQCTYYEGAVGSGIKWSSKWTWTGGENNVKSYVYAGLQLKKGTLISKVKGMPTTAKWGYDTDKMRCNVAYDIFTAADPNHANSSGDYELMIWLARYGGVWPISQSGSTPIATVTIAGYKFDLYFGYNGAMKVYSFLPPGSLSSTSAPYTNFSADIKLFFDYLIANQSFPASTQNLIVYQIGTEAFTGGPAKFSVSSFSAGLKL